MIGHIVDSMKSFFFIYISKSSSCICGTEQIIEHTSLKVESYNDGAHVNGRILDFTDFWDCVKKKMVHFIIKLERRVRINY